MSIGSTVENSSDIFRNQDQIKFLNSQIKKSKGKLEFLRGNQDKLMIEIQNWSDKREIEDKEVISQKVQLQHCVQEREELNVQLKLQEKEYNEDLDRMNGELENLTEIIKEKKNNKDGNFINLQQEIL